MDLPQVREKKRQEVIGFQFRKITNLITWKELALRQILSLLTTVIYSLIELSRKSKE